MTNGLPQQSQHCRATVLRADDALPPCGCCALEVLFIGVESEAVQYGCCAMRRREDIALTTLYRKHGSQWSSIAKHIDGRTAQQCRARRAFPAALPPGSSLLVLLPFTPLTICCPL